MMSLKTLETALTKRNNKIKNINGESGIIEECDSPWAPPVVMVSKTGGEVFGLWSWLVVR
jgi:hypothetical protein